MSFLYNTNIVVALGFLLFVAILVYFGAPKMILSKLDARSLRIKADLDEARALRDEAHTLLAAYERKQKEVKSLADEIVSSARVDAERAAESGKEEIRRSVARRVQKAADQIAAAENSAIRQIKDRAVTVAIAAAADVMRSQMQPSDADALIDAAIADPKLRMH